jgi:ligand-binding sensor domain-containing protein
MIRTPSNFGTEGTNLTALYPTLPPLHTIGTLGAKPKQGSSTRRIAVKAKLINELTGKNSSFFLRLTYRIGRDRIIRLRSFFYKLAVGLVISTQVGAETRAASQEWPPNMLNSVSAKSLGLHSPPETAAADAVSGLWIAARGELVRWTAEGLAEHHLSAQTAWMEDGRVTSIAVNHGAVWFGTPSGVGRIGHGAPAWFGLASGLPDLRITALLAPSETSTSIVAGTWRGAAHSTPVGFHAADDHRPVMAFASPESAAERLVVSHAGSPPPCGDRITPGQGPRFATTMLFDRQNTLWAGDKKGLWRCRDEWDLLGSISGVLTLAQDSDGRLWIGSRDGVSLREGDQLSLIPGPTEAASVVREHGAGVVVGTWGDGLWACDSEQCLRYKGIATDARVADIAIDPGGSVWVTAEGDLFQCDRACSPYRDAVVDAAGELGPIGVRRSTVWIGVPGGGGIIRISPSQETQHLAPNRVLPDVVIHQLLATADGLWLATDAGLVRYSASQFIPQLSPQASRSGTPAYGLSTGRNGRLLVGLHGSLQEVSGERRRQFPAHGIGGVRALIQNGDNIWAGGSSGLLQIDADGTAINHTEQLPSPGVRDISLAPDGSIWVGTSAGLAHWKDASWRTYTVDDGMPSNVVWTVHNDSRGGVWVGTYGAGAARFDGTDFRRLNSSHGLPSNVVREIFEDGAGRLCLLTNLGLSALQIDRLPDLRKSTFLSKSTFPMWLAVSLITLLLLALSLGIVRLRRR